MKRGSNWTVTFLLRGGIGMMSVYFINSFLESAGFAVSVGIGAVSAIISGMLGAPGVLLLYGINLCSLLLP